MVFLKIKLLFGVTVKLHNLNSLSCIFYEKDMKIKLRNPFISQWNLEFPSELLF